MSQPIEDPATKLDLSEANPDEAEFDNHIPTPSAYLGGGRKEWRVKGQWRGKARNTKEGRGGGEMGGGGLWVARPHRSLIGSFFVCSVFERLLYAGIANMAMKQTDQIPCPCGASLL